MKGEILMASEKILNDGLRKQFTTELMELLRKSGYDVMQVGTNELCIPCVDAERNDKYVTFTIKVPTGERGGDPYDGYAMAEDYEMKCKAKAEREREKEAEKQKKIARDTKRRNAKKSNEGE